MSGRPSPCKNCNPTRPGWFVRSNFSETIMMGHPLAFTLVLILTLLVFESTAFLTGPGRQSRLTPRFSSPSDESNKEEAETVQPDLLLPFLPAADPMFAVRGEVGDKDFVLDRCGGPTKAELTNENILKIVNIECSDLEVGNGLEYQPEL